MCSISPEHAQNISKSVIPEVWMYYSYLKENWQKVSDEPEYVQKHYKEHFVKMYGYEIEYIEEDPFVVQTKALLDKFIAEKVKTSKICYIVTVKMKIVKIIYKLHCLLCIFTCSADCKHC